MPLSQFPRILHVFCLIFVNLIFLTLDEQNTIFSFPLYTGYTQKNGAVSKVNKKFISHHTRAQRTPSAAATVQVSQRY